VPMQSSFVPRAVVHLTGDPHHLTLTMFLCFHPLAFVDGAD
jgi:hypothetical protein